METKMSRSKGGIIDKAEEELNALLGTIDGFRDYESNWHPDDPRVSEVTILSAKSLVQRVFNKCRRGGIEWRRPLMCVDYSARINVEWGERGGIGARWIVAAEEPIIVVMHRPHAEPVLEEMTAEAAVEAAIEALCPDCSKGE